jgi:nicotinate-nucleotide adenylyltransferase
VKVLVFGGSFDPPHRGHAALLRAAAGAIRPDRILIVPAFQAPLKGAPAATAAERAKLVELGIVNALPGRWKRITKTDTSELKARKRVYTVQTLRRLAKPGTEIHFVVGSDSAVNFRRWREPRALKALATWWCGGRPGTNGSVPSFFRRVPGRFPDISSTKIRSALAFGEIPRSELNPRVLDMIQERGLYGLALLAKLKSTLKESRYHHTLSVARWAEELAAIHHEDPARARLAGLLHDAGRRFSPAELPAYCRRRKLKVPAFEKTARLAPLLLHAYASADLARREFRVEDPAVLSAIAKHTLGGRPMSRFDRLVYAADATSPDRAYPGAAALRARARRDLDGAFRACVKAKLAHARASGGWIHPLTESLWKSLAAR